MARFDEGFFTSGDGRRLYWRSEQPENARAHVALVHGYGDHTGRYLPVIEALAGQGYAVHAFDYRGHGRADGRRGHCDAWSEFLLDLTAFWTRVRAAAGGGKLFLIGHSHGGLMAVHQAAAGGLPGLSGLVLSSPFFKLALTPPKLKLWTAKAIARVVPWAPIPTELTPEQLSRDEAMQRATREDPLYNRIATPRWFLETERAQARVMELAPGLQFPLLMISGEADSVAKVETQRAFFDAVGARDKRYKSYPGMRHEPFNELGREQVYQDISNWISERL